MKPPTAHARGSQEVDAHPQKGPSLLWLVIALAVFWAAVITYVIYGLE